MKGLHWGLNENDGPELVGVLLLIGIGEGQETSVAGSHFPELLNPLIEDTES